MRFMTAWTDSMGVPLTRTPRLVRDMGALANHIAGAGTRVVGWSHCDYMRIQFRFFECMQMQPRRDLSIWDHGTG